jgi:SAM-dependent methyltransferase
MVSDAIRLPFRQCAFDLLVCQDVVEHLDDDIQALVEMHRVCSPEGLALVLVPAFDALWSSRDVDLGHRRRYTLAALRDRMRRAGFAILRETYTDALLMPLLWGAVKLAPRNGSGVPRLPADAAPGAGPLNRALLAFSRLEAAWASRLGGLPFGVSALVLGQKPPA